MSFELFAPLKKHRCSQLREFVALIVSWMITIISLRTKLNKFLHNDGFGTSKLIEKSGIWTFKDIGVSAEHSSEIPIGRYQWTYKDRTCPTKASAETSLTFSRCGFDDQFTCDSGQCITKHGRCNGINDCNVIS